MLETDRSGLSKMKKSIKALSNSGKGMIVRVLMFRNESNHNNDSKSILFYETNKKTIRHILN